MLLHIVTCGIMNAQLKIAATSLQDSVVTFRCVNRQRLVYMTVCLLGTDDLIFQLSETPMKVFFLFEFAANEFLAA